MKSRRHHQSRWAHCNTSAARRRRRAAEDAKREARASTLPPAYAGPEPLSAWQTVQVFDAAGNLQHTVELRVPTSGRCDQHAAEVDGRLRLMLTATDVGRVVAGWIAKRPSLAMVAEVRREESWV